MTAHDPTHRLTRERPTLCPELAALLQGRRAELRAEMIDGDPRLAEISAATHPGPVPVDARRMIPDATLRRWMRGEPEMLQGELSPELQRELAMLLCDLAHENLARRYAMEGPRG